MENNEIINQISNLLELTKNGKVEWIMPQPPNQNIVKWDRAVSAKTYTTTLQKQPLQLPPKPGVVPQISYFYFLTIAKMSPPPAQVILQLNSQTESQYKDALESLYIVAVDTAKQSYASIFKELLKDL